MPGPEIWGPPVWIFFHTLAEKINDNYFTKMKMPVLNIIKLIAKNLPCPKCSKEASIFLEKMNANNIRTKQELINYIYMFHNYVNKKNNKPLFNSQKIGVYKSLNVYKVFINFTRVFHTRGNMQLLTESFQRTLAIKSVRKWLIENRAFLLK